LQSKHDFACGEELNLELAVGRLGDRLAHHIRAAVERVERLRPATCHPLFYFRHRLRNGRRGNDGRGNADARSLQELTTFHFITFFVIFWLREPANSVPRYLTLRGLAQIMTEQVRQIQSA
jgi:hypothetical protein